MAAELSWVVRAANRVGPWVTREPSLEPARLVAEARRRTGLHDFGDADVMAALERLTASFQAEARLSFLGGRLVRRDLLRRLMNLLHIQAVVDSDPSVMRTVLHRPLVVTGLPRSGTTFLQRLLAGHPDNRTLRFYELVDPAAPDPVAFRKGLARYQRVLFSARGRALRQAIHPASAEDPEECWHLLANTFRSPVDALFFGLEGYARWLFAQDAVPAYRHYARQLRVLCRGAAQRRLVLKCPSHLASLQALLKVLPDVRVVWLHRDPVQAVASTCSLVRLRRSLAIPREDPTRIGRQTLDLLSTSVARGLDARLVLGEQSFVDLSFKALVNDPLATVEQLYDRLGERLDPAARQHMKHAPNHLRVPRGRPHRYNMEDFGLASDRVRAAFAQYGRRFSDEW